MSDAELTNLVSRSFLARVPDIMEKNPDMTVSDAIEEAYKTEESFLIEIWDGRSDIAQEVRTLLASRVYRALRS